MATTTETAEPKSVRWSQQEYYRMAEIGLFDDKRVELIEGEIVEMSPMLSPHATAIILVGEALHDAFDRTYLIRAQLPLDLSQYSLPEPDVAVILGKVRDYSAAHPTSALLVVEISKSPLAFERGLKSRLYASAGIADYWILDLEHKVLEVQRNPVDGVYSSRQTLSKEQSVSPLAAPQTAIVVADLLP